MQPKLMGEMVVFLSGVRYNGLNGKQLYGVCNVRNVISKW